jgi:hypothetical protein
MAPTRLRFFALAPVLALVGCFNSDERAGADETSTTMIGGDTVTMYSDETEGENDDNWTAEETGPFSTTCRDAIQCLVMCQSAAAFNPMPEPDLSCFLECDKDLSAEEAYLLIKLAECIGLKCSNSGACGPESTDMACLTCIAANATDLQPPGCRDEADACQ